MTLSGTISSSTDDGLERSTSELGGLAVAGNCHEPIQLPGGDRGWLVDGLRRMILIRAAEERIGDMVTAGRIRCPCHLAIGQEAPAVGVALQVREGDRLFGAHRSHAHYLALGGSLRGLMAEVLGKDTGASRGMGGSMHLIDRAHGLYGTVPIVGATIPIAAGAALAAKMDGKGAVAVSYFGDGATEEGVFHETMNLAATHRLPVLFVCEHNFFASHLHISLRQPAESVARYAEAHRVGWARVDGNDLVAMTAAVREAFETMRAGGGPRFIEAVTYRWRGHVGPREDDDVGVRRKDDLHLWRLRDPVRRLAEALIAAGEIAADAVETMTAEAKGAVAAAWEQAERDPFPAPGELLGRVYADGAPR
ncbi:MAG: thiamine pyrophosphate-dependent dehydrogenase E1 component subunit alpha [Gemmatimonadales bacterium]